MGEGRSVLEREWAVPVAPAWVRGMLEARANQDLSDPKGIKLREAMLFQARGV